MAARGQLAPIPAVHTASGGIAVHSRSFNSFGLAKDQPKENYLSQNSSKTYFT